MSEAPQAIAVKGGPLRPGTWYTGLADPERDVVVGGGAVARLLHFKDTPPSVEQPALTENILVLHLGDGKRVSRERGVRREVFDVPSKRLTIIPAFEANRWHTYGPRNFAHLTLSTGFLAKLAVEEFDRDPREMALLDQIAFGDELLSSVYLALLEETRKARDGLYQETLLLTAALHVLGNRSTLKSDRTGGGRSVRGGLASWQLRRLVDFINAHLAEEISILQLSELTGLSRAQFFSSVPSIDGNKSASLCDLGPCSMCVPSSARQRLVGASGRDWTRRGSRRSPPILNGFSYSNGCLASAVRREGELRNLMASNTSHFDIRGQRLLD